jgi:hypothetical protein
MRNLVIYLIISNSYDMDYTIEKLKYPIGKYKAPEVISENQISDWIAQINDLPSKLRAAVSGLTDVQLNTPYRKEGWTLRQVVHHIPDSHMNGYIRFKVAITEENPVIRPYYENRWAECDEAKNADVNISIDLLESLHRRWVLFLRSLKYKDFEHSYIHPENKSTYILKEATGLYAWHGEHHLHHILSTRERNNW